MMTSLLSTILCCTSNTVYTLSPTLFFIVYPKLKMIILGNMEKNKPKIDKLRAIIGTTFRNFG